MAALVVMPQRFLYSIGVAGAAVGLLSAFIAILVIPALLRLLGTKVNALSIRSGPAVSAESGAWHRLAQTVMRHPVLIGGASAVLLLAAASPLTGTTLTGPSAEAVPPGQPSYEPGEYVERHYPRDVSEAVTVAVRGRASPEALATFERRLRRIEGVERVPPFRARRRHAFTNLALDAPALSERSQDAVRAIRDLPEPRGADVLVAGNTARFVDQKASLPPTRRSSWHRGGRDAHRPLPAHRLGPAAGEDARHERADARRHARACSSSSSRRAGCAGPSTTRGPRRSRSRASSSSSR